MRIITDFAIYYICICQLKIYCYLCFLKTNHFAGSNVVDWFSTEGIWESETRMDILLRSVIRDKIIRFADRLGVLQEYLRVN